MAIPVIYETKASKYLLNSYFTDETDILQVGYGGGYGTVNGIGTHDIIYFGLSFYAPEHVETYPMVVPYTEIPIYDSNTGKWIYRYDWHIEEYQDDIRRELDSHTEADIYFYVKAIKDDIAYIAWQKGRIAIVNNTAPSFEGDVIITVTDTLSKNLTGNNTTIIRGVSDASVQFNAVANKGSYLVGYQVKNGSKSVYSTSILTQETAQITHTVNDCESGTFELMIEDSRGFRTKTSASIDFIEYFKPTVHITNTIAVSPYGGDTVIKIGGQCFNGSFNGGATNNGCSVQVYGRLVGSTSWTNYGAANVTKNGNDYTATMTLVGLNYRNQYEFRARISDSVTGLYSETVLAQGITVFDWSNESFRFNVPVNIKKGVDVTGPTNIEGATTITGDLNVIGSITVSEPESGGSSNAGYENGHWLPQVNCISSPTHAYGKWVRVGPMCIINFYIQGVTTSTTDKVEITNFPFTPSSDTDYFRWQSGGGFCINYAVIETTSSSSSSDVDRSTHRFTGWSIEGGKLYGRTQSTQKGTSKSTSGDSIVYTRSWRIIDDGYYIGAVAGYTFRASGTLMYLIDGMED